MLELKAITKVYPAGDGEVRALKGIDLRFRRNEFVSILGPSGCGKTTLLNIIGGLDQYTSGDLLINGTSTKRFKDRDWDTYRNHSIGFVFQSYHLIPHQTVLRNVELALTLSGVSKKERRERAKQALVDVGLGDQLSKKPNEMSGGQMQRVAIARALVNNPEIILADEPTGALDTETGIQVMEMLKEISKKHLIIMVTHNPELAERYSSRIIRMLDGKITDDSAPLAEEEYKQEVALDRTKREAPVAKKPSMSFMTAFGLSLKNLFTKKGRTILTSFAGSIGIIGIALILAVSQGMTGYINHVQESTLSSYPLTIEAEQVDLMSLMSTFMNIDNNKEEHPNDAVYKDPTIYSIIDALTNLETNVNDLISFKKYLEDEMQNEQSKFSQSVAGIQYTYNLDLQIYTENVDGTVLRSDTETLMMDMLAEYMQMDMSGMTSSMEGSPLGAMSSASSSTGLWQELLPGKNGESVNDILKKQYEIVDEGGRWPEAHDEIVLVLGENNELNDLALYALGLISKDEIAEIFDAYFKGEPLEYEEQKWSYEEIRAREYRTILPAFCYYRDAATGLSVDRREQEGGLKYLYESEDAIPLKVVGIIRPREDTDAPMLKGSIAYTSKLTEHVIRESAKSEALAAQLASPTIDILTGRPFKENAGTLTSAQKAAEFKKYVNALDNERQAMLYIGIYTLMPTAALEGATDATLASMTRADKIAALKQGMAGMGIDEDKLDAYFDKMTDAQIDEMMRPAIAEQIKGQYAAEKFAEISMLSAEERVARLRTLLETATDEQCGEYYDGLMTFSESSYEQNLLLLGDVNLDSPATINLYTTTFEKKDLMMEAIDDYNLLMKDDESKQIEPTDMIGLLMSSVTLIIDAISYVLIAFVSISLVVSSIMIGVITLISVQERTKEIGILRAIGASKRDVSSMFNAETLIIGVASGLFGVLVTYILCIPINMILYSLTGIAALKASLPFGAAVILVLISMALTLFAGIIPSRSAAKKDPVVALRTE